jgi:hypothetical protein
MYDLSLDSTSLVNKHNDLYSTLQSIGEDYGVIVIANQRITDKSQVVIPGQGNLDWMLRASLKPIKMDWLMADHAIYVDRESIL